jgi:hypothetical protein
MYVQIGEKNGAAANMFRLWGLWKYIYLLLLLFPGTVGFLFGVTVPVNLSPCVRFWLFPVDEMDSIGIAPCIDDIPGF